MLTHYLIISWRVVQRNIRSSAIKLFGLSFCILFAILDVLYINDELSFDTFYSNGDRIYRIDHFSIRDNVSDSESRMCIFPIPFKEVLTSDVSAPHLASRYDSRDHHIKVGANQFLETIHYVDREFVKIFTPSFFAGGVSARLADPQSLLLSSKKAITLFGGIDKAVGGEIEIEKRLFRVAGVFEDLPDNSSLEYNFLVPYEFFPQYTNQRDDWNSWYSPVFIMFESDQPKGVVQAQIEKCANRFFPRNQTENVRIGITLTALTQIHFDDQISWHKVSNLKYSYWLSVIAISVILIACINYILISLASSLRRVKEIGVRKNSGASSGMIRAQFLIESLILTILSIPIGLAIAYLVLPSFNDLTEKALSLSILMNIKLVVIATLIVVTISGFAGAYPAFVLARLKPQTLIRQYGSGGHRTNFGNYLVAFQFIACSVLIVTALVMYRQIRMMYEKDLGFNKENVLIIDAENDAGVPGKGILNLFRTELSNEPDIKMISALQSDFGRLPGSSSRKDRDGKVTSEYYCGVDYDFFKLTEIDLKEGRFFQREIGSDSLRKYVINERLAKQIGDSSLIGKPLPTNPNSEIIGIAKDFNFEPLNYEIKPMAFSIGIYFNSILVKIESDDVEKTITKLETSWRKMIGKEQFKFTFLATELEQKYKRFSLWSKIAMITTGCAIAISFLGLFGVVSLVISNRMKEISVRRIMGASSVSLCSQFSGTYLILTAISFVIAIPVIVYLSSIWLQNFAYRVDISFWDFIIPLMLMACLVIGVVINRVLGVTNSDLAASIKSE